MLSLTHASAGALVGEFIGNPFLAFLAGVAVHFIMDKIPHFWPESEQKKGKIIILDTIFSTIFILLLVLIPQTSNASIIAGALGGVSVDFYFVLLMRSKGKMAEWHTRRQLHRKQPSWFLSDVLIFLGLTVLLIATLR